MARIILASQSPRRKQLMEAAELDFEVITADVDETNPPGMPGEQVPEFLALKKAAVIAQKVKNKIIVAADTVVLLDHDILGKPADEAHAIEMLTRLSGRTHQVVTGVCIMQRHTPTSFSVTTEVCFRPLTSQQVYHYVSHYRPFDKAGAYAIQEWIGMIGIERIDGDYYNVMGLPIGEVVKRLKEIKDI